MHRSTDGGQTWSERIRINNDLPSPNVQSDQFFPAVTVDTSGYVHVIWYDTRDDPQPKDAQHVKIGLYYARFDHDDEPLFENHKIDDQTIDTRSLLSPGFIGDYNSITMVGSDTVVAVYMGTSHLRFIPPQGGIPIVWPADETIFCTRIVWQ